LDRVLLLETSTTRRRAMHALLSSKGFHVTELPDYAEALPVLESLGSSAAGYRGIVIGWPDYHESHADRIFAHLRSDEYEHVAVLLLADGNDGAAVNWMMKRPSTALLLWSDYSECADALTKLINPPSKLLPDLDGGGQSHLRVLFVDDSATVRVAFRRLLMKHGYLVETAENVEAGWNLARNAQFDLAIVDYFMPGDPGTVLVQRMKNEPRTRAILSAIITGTYSERVINESLAAGALECLFKSEARELFMARLSSLARAVQDRKSIDAERRRLSSILNSVGDGVYGVNERGVIQFINPAALDLLGYNEEKELIGRSAYQVFHHSYEDGTPVPRSADFLSQCYAKGGQIPGWQTVFWTATRRSIPVECTVYPMQIDGQREGSVIAFRDISARRMLEEELRWQAGHDALTNLHNRAWFEAQLEQDITRLKNTENISLLMFLDLDRFKYINDTAGHTAGDQLLIEIGRRLSSRLRASDHIARMGGDEYAVILRNVNRSELARIADEFRKALSALPFTYGGKSYRVGVSIGVTKLDKNTPSRSDAMAAADVALHVAKRNGRDQVHVFSVDSDQRSRMDMELGWTARLETALKDQGFLLCFQPILPLANVEFEQLPSQQGALWSRHFRKHVSAGQRVFYETLIRLRDPDGNVVEPGAFLPAAERFNLIADIDRWVIRNAFDTLRQHQGPVPVGLSINLSPNSLSAGDMGRFITDCFVEFNVDPRAVVFEFTEVGALNHIEAVRHLIQELRPFGCRFALDDFGVGFSSFGHLKHLDVDFLKIDGSFIQDLLNEPVDRAVITSITSIARSIGKITIAEHVDRPEILRALHSCGVDQAQGFYIARPKSSFRAANSQIDIVSDNESSNVAVGNG
jgi:diguanylate cyclase (GGDEF)-like protein/PAS domain S-box-containing protein